MNRLEAFSLIAKACDDRGFTFLDVLPFFKGVAPSQVQIYLEKAYALGFITTHPVNTLCMYPTQKLRNLAS